MKIIDEDKNKIIPRSLLLLTEDEARQLRADLDGLLRVNAGRSSSTSVRHTHFCDDREDPYFTVCIYNKDDLSTLHPDLIKLLKEAN